MIVSYLFLRCLFEMGSACYSFRRACERESGISSLLPSLVFLFRPFLPPFKALLPLQSILILRWLDARTEELVRQSELRFDDLMT